MTTADRAVVIHGHYYQPPREDPWLEEVPREPGASPYHDWNTRIERECYRAVTAARMIGRDGRIARIVNTLEHTSFDFGPTLLAWLERAAPDTYRAVLDADRASAARSGYGNAIAMPGHHVILPLARRRDVETEVRWGIADFRRRFGREPTGMWLPETAVDDATLDVLATEGIRFTVLAPHQVRGAPPTGAPGLYTTSGGRRIALFSYDGPISHDVAFGPLLSNARAWADRLVEGQRQLVSVATDGETFGHHHRFGEMALAAVIDLLATHPGIRLENFSAFLATHPPAEPVTLVAPSSWSCPHGVERWRSDCGCRAHPERPTHQGWRAVLREALDWLAGELHAVYDDEGTTIFGDPWAARDAYGAVLHDPVTAQAAVREWLRGPPDGLGRAMELLEMERNALRMFTSCGWFFDDIGGVESLIVLRYAARAIELAGPRGAALEPTLVKRLSHAESNDPTVGNGRDIYLRWARPRIPPAARVAAAAALAAALGLDPARAVPTAWAAAHHEGVCDVRHVRTGAAATFRCVPRRASPGRLSVIVRSADGSDHELGVPDLPESSQEILRARLRAELMERWFDREAHDAVASGTPPAIAAERALRGAVSELRHDSNDADVRVEALADLLELFGHPVPFDVQTEFYRVRAALPADRAAALEHVAHRLGFA
ncbi:MAG TPA: DUF3536 domain-containing protein [Gemmatimonadales bacterium]|nr:DUF3536 domain-containing protein [Gemmatimonadales bacterium]